MMPSKGLILLSLCLLLSASSASPLPQFNDTAGFQFPDPMSFNAAAAECDFSQQQPQPIVSFSSQRTEPLKLNLKRRRLTTVNSDSPSDSVLHFQSNDLLRIRNHQKRIAHKNTKQITPQLHRDRKLLEKYTPAPESQTPAIYSGQLMATLESGVSSGSGEYFMDVFVGTPPKHFSLILDTGSDLNWIQCAPCLDCFEQNGPHYDPNASTTFRKISCNDQKCKLVTSPEPKTVCKSKDQGCPYFYWYGDSSNSTGDFATETFTVNLTSVTGRNEFLKVENVMFGCGHWNKGLFHGAAGLLGLGRGALSFSSQLQALYGHSFSYCLVDRNSDASVSSKLIFGEDAEMLSNADLNLNYTTLLTEKENKNLVDTFYYIDVKSIVVGGEVLNIPEEIWNVSPEGIGGTIVDSGTTLSYFTEPAYKLIKQALIKKIKTYPRITDFPLLDPCYNVTGAKTLKLPEFGIVFRDGAIWNFPTENYFIRLEPEEVVCLALMGAEPSGLSIIGNYQQQNFHIVYDTKNSRLGFAPRMCAEV